MNAKWLRAVGLLVLVGVAPGCCAWADRWCNRGRYSCAPNNCCCPCPSGYIAPAPAGTIPPTAVPAAAHAAPGCN